jgi:HAE1 family hydrophobic/amphiphilic exporter-1
VSGGFLLDRIVPAYRKVLGWTLRHRFVTLAGLLVMAGTAAFPIAVIEKSGEPKVLEREVVISYEIHDPSTKDVLEGYVDQVEGWVESRRDELGFDTMYSWYDENGPDVMTRVYLPKNQITEKAIRRLREGLRRNLPVIPGVTLTVAEREWWRRGRRGERTVRVALHGEDPEFLQTLAFRVEERLRKLPDVKEVLGPSIVGTREARLVVDPDKARAFGVTPNGVADAVGFAFRGQRLRRFEGPNGEIELVVGLPDEARPGLVTLADLPLPAEGGGSIPLSSVAEMELTRTPPYIRRFDRMTTQWVAVQFDEEAVANTKEGMDRVSVAMNEFRLPDGYAWSWGEWGHRHFDSLGTMLRGVLLSLLIVVLLLMALFESFVQPLAIVITLPLAFFGAFWALWIFGFQLDPVAFFGVILLIGIVVNNGIVMVNHVNDLRRQGKERVAALIEGCGDRLRPVLMTAITTVFGILPLGLTAFNVRGAPMGSLATAIAGGLATSTIFTLVGLPVWYTMVEDLWSVVIRTVVPRWSGERSPRTAP